jgi:type VI secretion system protein ImpK
MSDPNGSGPNRTVFQPSPLSQMRGQAATPQPAAEANYQPPRSAGVRDDIPEAPQGLAPRNPMMTSAAPLLALLASMRSGRARMKLPDLHKQAAADIELFRRDLAGVYNEEELRRATYALAATADDIALNLPFEETDVAAWAQRSLVVRFFHEAIGGDRFWRLLEEMVARPAEYANLLELYHACMGAGFEGRYRVMPGGRPQLEALMQQVFRALPHPPTLSKVELSPRWRGVEAAASTVGPWTRVAIVAAAAAGILLVVFLALHTWIGFAGRDAREAVAKLVPDEPLTLSRQAPPVTTQASTQGDSIRKRLAARIQAGQVEVIDEPTSIRVRTTVGGLFAPGSDRLMPAYDGLFQEVAQALNAEPGAIKVEGHTDSDRPRGGLTFTDNRQLAQARADAAATIIRGALTDKGRPVTAESFGDARPLKPNDSPAGKAGNRRVEVVIERSGR